MKPLLAVEHISKTYGNSRVLQDVAFDLQPGEVHALVGENGAGKSTLIKIIAGVEQPDAGSVFYFNGEKITGLTPQKAIKQGVAVIYQEISLFPNLTVAENIVMDYESKGWLHWREMRRQAAQILKEMGCDWDVNEELGHLSLGRQQLVALARAIHCQAKIVVMDEPTSALSQNEVKILFQAIDRLRQQAGIIYISHKLEEIFQIADRVTVLRDGQKIATHPTAELDEETLIQMMVGRELGFTPFLNQQPLGKELFCVAGLSKKGLFEDISFTLHQGEILGMTGLVGAKRTEVALALFGMLPADSGSITLAGKPLQIKSPASAIAQGVCYLPEDRRNQGLFLQKNVVENISASHLQAFKGRFGILDRRKEMMAAQNGIRQLQIKPANPWLQTAKMSGGNQQKVLFSHWLQAQPKVLIVDEPTSGVDIGAKQEIHRLLRQLAEQGIGVLMISSDLPEILAVSDRILVMCQGKITACFAGGCTTQEEIMAKSLNGA